MVTKAWCTMLDRDGVEPAKSRKLAAQTRVRLQQYREFVWATRTSIKHGGEMELTPTSKGKPSEKYKKAFIPMRDKNRHDKVQTVITTYTGNTTPDW